MDRHHVALLRQLQELQFVSIDLILYLDTHPEDRNAMEHYNRVGEQLRTLRMTYEERYGPLTVQYFTPPAYPWQWVEQPWPWEIEY